MVEYINSVKPLISVIIPAYNAGDYIEEALLSIKTQTYPHFECIVIDDGSVDQTAEICSRFVTSDSRFRLISRANRGLAKTLNELVAVSKGRYIARQDADDVSRPDRLAKQLDYFIHHPKCGVLGTWSEILNDGGVMHDGHHHPQSNKEIRLILAFDSPFVHTSVMFDREKLGVNLFYPEKLEEQPEDYALWTRLASLPVEFGNLPLPLVVYREVATSITKKSKDPFPFVHLTSYQYMKKTFFFLPNSFLLKLTSAYRGKYRITSNFKRYIFYGIGLSMQLRFGRSSKIFRSLLRQAVRKWPT